MIGTKHLQTAGSSIFDVSVQSLQTVTFLVRSTVARVPKEFQAVAVTADLENRPSVLLRACNRQIQACQDSDSSNKKLEEWANISYLDSGNDVHLEVGGHGFVLFA